MARYAVEDRTRRQLSTSRRRASIQPDRRALSLSAPVRTLVLVMALAVAVPSATAQDGAICGEIIDGGQIAYPPLLNSAACN
eukprot:COSAG02_NODE_44827_length_362_cov_1.346008_1_plen_81_part_01